MPIILSRKDLREILSMAEVIDAVEAGFREYKTGRCVIPVRMPVEIARAEGVFLFMPAYMEGQNAFGTKIISVFPRNPARGLSTLQSVYLLNDPETGQVLSLMDGVLLTAMRTGAASAVATKYLARKDARVLGVIGAGAQAPFQAEAVCSVLNIEKVLAYDTHPERLRGFSSILSEGIGKPVEVGTSAEEVVSQSDVLVTATTSREPVFDGSSAAQGIHINAVGAFTPEMREVDSTVIGRALVVVDTYEGAMAEAGDLLIPMKEGTFTKEKIHADLGEIVTGKRPGRSEDWQITLFKSVGHAMEDLVTARLAYLRAKERGVGQEFSLDGG